MSECVCVKEEGNRIGRWRDHAWFDKTSPGTRTRRRRRGRHGYKHGKNLGGFTLWGKDLLLGYLGNLVLTLSDSIDF